MDSSSLSQSSLSSSPTVVPLPHRTERQQQSPSKPPIWPIVASGDGASTPLPSKCARTTRQDGVCCKELIKEERTLIDPDIIRDVVIGLSDGLTVPFALAAGLSSLGESRLVVLGGFAELIAGAISMGIGGFLASQSERDHYRYLRSQTSQRVKHSCAGEMEREVSEVLGPIGVDEKTCRSVARSLREVELDENSDYASSNSSDVETSSLRWSKDVGLTAFLLKFGQGLEEIPDRRMYTSAFTIGMGYLLGGLIPLFPYFFVPKAQLALLYSCILTGIVLLIFGAIKARVTGAGVTAGSYIWSAVSTLMVGGIAAGAAFVIVKAMEG